MGSPAPGVAQGIRVMRPTHCAVTLLLSLAMLAGIGPASAQTMSPWGMWGERPDRPKAYRSGPRGREADRRDRYAVDPPWWDDNPFMERRTRRPPPGVLTGGPRPVIVPREPEIVAFDGREEPGTIVIDTEKRRLYFTLEDGEAYAYPISVGRDGFTWTGTERISRIADWPDWHPPKEMRERDPRLPEKMTGGLRNPLGSKALFLGNSLYRIHGTNDPKTIGLAASSGCFRMMNEHVEHLAGIAPVGTEVKVLDSVSPPEVVADLPWLQKPAALGMSKENVE